MAIIDEQNIFGKPDLNKTAYDKTFPMSQGQAKPDSFIDTFDESNPYSSGTAVGERGNPVTNRGASKKTIADSKGVNLKGSGKDNIFSLREKMQGLTTPNSISFENLRPTVTDAFLDQTLKAVVDSKTDDKIEAAIQNRIKRS